MYTLKAYLFYSASKKYKAEVVLPLEDNDGELAFSDENDDEQAYMEKESVRIRMMTRV